MEDRRDRRFSLRRHDLARFASILVLAAGVLEGRLHAQSNCDLEFVSVNRVYLPDPIWSESAVGPGSQIACGSQISDEAFQTVCTFFDDSDVVTMVPESAGSGGPSFFSQPLTPPSALGTPASSARLPRGYVPVAGADGFLRVLPTNPSSSPLVPVDLRRSDCPEDSLLAAPVVQLRSLSNDAFKAAQADDLILQITSYGCSTETANRIYAVRPFDMSVVWTFNDNGFGGSYAVNAGRACTVDYLRNSVYCVTLPSVAADRPTLFAVDTLNGSLKWSRNLGSIVAPALGYGGARLYVAGTSFVGAIDPDSGETIWSADLSGFGLDTEVPQVLALSDRPDVPTILLIGGKKLTAVRDDGSSQLWLWSYDDINGVVRGLGYQRGSSYVYYGDSSDIFQVNLLTGEVSEPRATGAFQSPLWNGSMTLERSVPTGPTDRLIAGSSGSASVSEFGIPWTQGERADTSVSIMGPTDANPGDQLVYSVTITNAGPAAATDVFLSNVPADFPGAVTFLDYGALSPSGSPGLATGANLGDLMAGTSRTVQVTLSAQTGGPMTLRLFVHSGEIDDDPSNNAYCFTTDIHSPDTTPPVISLPGNITVEASGSTGAIVNFTASAKDDQDQSPKVACVPTGGSLFPLGATTVTCTARDASGNVSSASFLVTVVDTTPPKPTLSSNLTVDATSPAGATVAYTVTATDLVDPKPIVSCAPLSGGVFPIGTTTVNCTATDFSKNSVPGSFTVTVNGALPQLNVLMARVKALGLPPGAAATLVEELTLVENALAASHKTVACALMEVFILEAEALPARVLSLAAAADLIPRATRIRAAIGCGG